MKNKDIESSAADDNLIKISRYREQCITTNVFIIIKKKADYYYFFPYLDARETRHTTLRNSRLCGPTLTPHSDVTRTAKTKEGYVIE